MIGNRFEIDPATRGSVVRPATMCFCVSVSKETSGASAAPFSSKSSFIDDRRTIPVGVQPRLAGIHLTRRRSRPPNVPGHRPGDPQRCRFPPARRTRSSTPDNLRLRTCGERRRALRRVSSGTDPNSCGGSKPETRIRLQRQSKRAGDARNDQLVSAPCRVWDALRYEAYHTATHDDQEPAAAKRGVSANSAVAGRRKFLCLTLAGSPLAGKCAVGREFGPIREFEPLWRNLGRRVVVVTWPWQDAAECSVVLTPPPHALACVLGVLDAFFAAPWRKLLPRGGQLTR